MKCSAEDSKLISMLAEMVLEVNISATEVQEYLVEQWRGHAALREEGAHTDLLLLGRDGGVVRAHRAGGELFTFYRSHED